MNVFLWILQVFVAVIFTMSGLVKIVQPREMLIPKYPWMRDYSPASVRFISVLEVLGAIGLVVPAATGIAPVLTPVAGTGLAIMMAGAMALHIRRGEPSGLPVTGVLFVLAVLVAWGRFGPYSG
ncbi:DoxX family protein [Nonomuraea deserti]|uniref:DoxX family protein n=1 Tax=Nonomuraea deserti TaxID=1848322 RepID=A0A4R4VR89_9ACTN|nr:DoxX family protein [Nonomuraea deserti]TDD08468.1 DoxX family protein [Nonomuraea deserti]